MDKKGSAVARTALPPVLYFSRCGYRDGVVEPLEPLPLVPEPLVPLVLEPVVPLLLPVPLVPELPDEPEVLPVEPDPDVELEPDPVLPVSELCLQPTLPKASAAPMVVTANANFSFLMFMMLFY